MESAVEEKILERLVSNWTRCGLQKGDLVLVYSGVMDIYGVNL